MKCKNLTYLAPETVEEACQLLATYGSEARVLSGGTDIMVRMRDGHWQPKYLIDIKKIPNLNTITYDSDTGLTIGATATLNQIAGSEVVQQHYPVLGDGAHSVGSMQVRNRATLIGNICNASPLADTAPALLVYEAQVTIIGPEGTRVLPIDQFFTGPGQTALQTGELVTRVTLPPIATDAHGRYFKHARRKAVDLASVGVALLVIGQTKNKVQEVRIALGAVAPVPLRATYTEALLRNTEITPELLEETKRKIFSDISPISDIRSSKEYRYEISMVLVRRGLQELLRLEDDANKERGMS